MSVKNWPIDTALFKSLAPGQRRTDSFRHWISGFESHEDPLFLSAASTGATPEATSPDEQSPADAAKARECGEKFDALFSQLQQIDKKDNLAVDKWGIAFFSSPPIAGD